MCVCVCVCVCACVRVCVRVCSLPSCVPSTALYQLDSGTCTNCTDHTHTQDGGVEATRSLDENNFGAISRGWHMHQLYRLF